MIEETPPSGEVLAALFAHSVPVLVVLIIVAGLILGVMNTVLTESSMAATDLPRPVASSAYSGVRFLGGALAPPVASALGAASGLSRPAARRRTGTVLGRFFAHFLRASDAA